MTIIANAIKPEADALGQQALLEQEMTRQGIERFRSAVRKAQEGGREESTTYGEALMLGLIDKVAAGLREFVEQREAGKAGRKGPTYKYIKMLNGDYDMAAYIALRIVISGVSSPSATFASVSGRIGRALEDEIRYVEVREQDRKFYEQLRVEAAKRVAPHVRRTVVNYFINKREMDLGPEWPEADVVLLGALLVEIIIQKTGLVEKATVVRNSTQTQAVIVATPETRKFIKDRIAAVEVMRPLYEPMIVPPMDWTGPRSGGYLTRSVRPLRLVKTFNMDYLNSLEEVDLTEVMEAVNVAQRTAWTINPFILSVLEIGWERDYSLGGIPMSQDLPIPPKPVDIDTNEENRNAWRKEAALVYRENVELQSKRMAFYTGVTIARRYSLFPEIFFPYQLDFRGRIYAAPQLNPQGPDWMKALLQFAEGKPLDEESAPFLAIHLANCGAFNKIDKAPLEERVQWVYDNQENIIACADNPIDNRWWTEADSPYCFLAACREWAGWVREGVGFKSHLAVALDGSCSGIQHFSMALADEVGGAAVNLVPSDKPADIYTLVLNKVVEHLNAERAGDSENAEIAQAWCLSGLLNRSLVKRPTMTYGYGSNQFGFKTQIATDTLRPAYKAYQRGEGSWHFEGNGFNAAVYLAGVTQTAVEKTVLKAAEAMAWLKAVAKVVTSEGLPVRWTTSDGFPVVQQYKEQDTHRIDTLLLGSRVRINMQTDTINVDKRKQASGLSPNFVHSLDATHLRLTVRQAASEGIKSFALVHDSFGTHAADTGRLFVILRETMVAMYAPRNVMQNFYEEIKGQLLEVNKPKLPLPPALGNLCIEDVVDCDFAFA